jgi:hypothetical protein
MPLRCESLPLKTTLPSGSRQGWIKSIKSVAVHLPAHFILTPYLILLSSQVMHQLDSRYPLNLLENITRRFIRQVCPFLPLLSLIISPPSLAKDDLMKQCRRGRKEFRFWLFNDSILYGESNGLGAYRPSRLIPLTKCRVTAVDENSEPAMRIESPEKSFYVWMKYSLLLFTLCPLTFCQNC